MLPAAAGSATAVWHVLGQASTAGELVDAAHELWCPTDCGQTRACTFLHYPRRALTAGALVRSRRPRYNRDTADLFTLMGGDGYMPGTPLAHETNLWPLLVATMAEIDAQGISKLDYTNWSQKPTSSAGELVTYACRDSVQWMANWCGERYAARPEGVRYIAFSTICDDLCIPPLDLLSGRFRLYGRSGRELAATLDESGWGRDGAHAMLSLVRQYVVQYIEKVNSTLHPYLNGLPSVWDAVVYRTLTANTYGAAIVVGRVGEVGPVSWTWLMDASICDAISMDLAKSVMDVYQLDRHQPTAHTDREQSRQTAYHAVYLDLIDDLVSSGAPEELVHFGAAGLLFVQLQERYRERRLGRRFPLRPAMASRLRALFGGEPTDPVVNQLADVSQANRVQL